MCLTVGKPANLYDGTNPDWAPSLNLGHATMKASESAMASERYNRKCAREKRKAHEGEQAAGSSAKKPKICAKKGNSSQTDVIQTSGCAAHTQDQMLSCGTDCAVQTDVSMLTFAAMQAEIMQLQLKNYQQVEEIQQLQVKNCQQVDEIQQLQQKNCQQVEENNQLKITEEMFKDDDTKVKYYTGLPTYAVLLTLFQFLEPLILKRTSLTKFQQYILVLIRLRLNLAVMDLSYRFNVSQATVCRVFNSMIDLMYARMQPLVRWPSREELWKTMPMEFRPVFGTKVVVIIDCFEGFIDRPSNLLARAQTWSSYKHHNTVKFLIGCCPQGVISFISKGWGGRVSDKHLTENCGILTKLLPGDTVLADRGFDIQESVGLMCAEVKIPAFTRGKTQLSSIDVQRTRKLAHLRIHIERVIGVVRQKYTILQGPVPINYLMLKHSETSVLMDKIVFVCCALCNLCEPVIPFQ